MPKQNREPIAIVGIGCRLPGGSDSPEAYWRMICGGKDAIGEVPPDRWHIGTYYDPTPGKNGKSISKWGGFIEGLDKFDPAFFGISPREADWMDPQQRLVLEACYEALEDGGQLLDKLRGSKTGVFVGVSTTDYAVLQSAPGERVMADVYTATGGTISIAANRVSYCFDFQGPSLSLDTACSSALTAVHVACQSLWKGDCTMALAAGVNAIIGPVAFIAFSRMSMLSPDGRCKAFDASANGFVRGEGVGAILLKPLSAAQAAGDPIYAVIRGTAANQDGRTNGLTVPSPIAQEALVRQACRDAGILPSAVKYIEAHGTGTPVGDPIEAHALGSALGDGRPGNEPCIMGSVKTNIGHLEAAAGIAGIIKVALVLKHGMIPPNLHFTNPNPNIDFQKLKLRVIEKMEPFPNDSGPMLAGINSFGFGGSNAHAILEAAPVTRTKRNGNGSSRKHASGAMVLPLSARSPEALQAVAKNYQALIKEAVAANGSGTELGEICRTSALRRTQHAHRLCAVAGSREEMVEKLDAFLAGEARPGLVVGQATAEGSPQPVFVFSGQGPQWWGMGRELMKEEPVFREKLAECDRLFRDFGGWSLLEEMRRDETSSRLDHTAIAQPAIFAVQVGLAALWESWGVRPSAVVGHSVGEVAAAQVAGILSLREAARVIFQRGRCMDFTAAAGRMLAVGMTPREVEPIVTRHRDHVAIAAFNSPASVTLSGEPAALEEIAHTLEQQGRFCRFLHVNYAFHSHQMDSVKDELIRALGTVELKAATLPMYSTVTGRQTDGLDLTAPYWWRNVREPVHFSAVIDQLIEKGQRLFVELSAHPALLFSLTECLAARSVSGVVLSSLRRLEPERATMLGTLGALHVAGSPVGWEGLYPGEGDEHWVRLPAYPWQRERYWHEPGTNREVRLEPPPHPFLTRASKASDPGWVTWLDQEATPYLKDHRVQGHIVFPAAGYIETGLGLGRKVFGSAPIRIEDIDFQKALFLPEGRDVVQMQTSFNPADLTLKFSSRADQAGEGWTQNAIGKLRHAPQETPPEPVDLEAIVKRCSVRELSAKEVYGAYDYVGLIYGPAFRGVETIWRRDGEAIGKVRLPDELLGEAANYLIHPALLDACFHVHIFSVPTNNSLGAKMLLPVFLERVRFFERPGQVVWCHAQVIKMGSRFAVWDFQILDEQGRLLIDLQGFKSQAPSGSRSARLDNPEEWLCEQRWKLKPLKEHAPAETGRRFLKTTSDIAQAVEQGMRLRAGVNATDKRWRKLEQDLNALACSYLVEAFKESGWQLRPGQKVSVESLAKKLGAAPDQRESLSRQLCFLESRRMLTRSGTGWQVCRRAPRIKSADMWLKLLREYPAAHPELTLLRRWGTPLAAILKGEVDAAKVISPDGSTTLLEHFYQDSVSRQDSNRLVAEAISVALKDQPVDRVIRILEVGAGAGGLTTYVLPKLRSDRTEYVFSDSDETLLAKAEKKFFEYSFVRYQALDIGKALEEQGFQPASFDVLIVSDTLRAVHDLHASLANMRRLLAAGGLLVLLEQTQPPAWFEFVSGPWLEGRPFAGNVSGAKAAIPDRIPWEELLAKAGFEPTEIENTSARRGIGGFELLVAQAPETAFAKTPATEDPKTNPNPARWLLFADHDGTAEEFANLLRARGDHPILVFGGATYRRRAADYFEISPSSKADMLRLLADLRETDSRPLAGVVHLWSLDLVESQALNAELFARAEALTCHSTLYLVQALTGQAASNPPPLWLASRGAHSVHSDEVVACVQAPVYGIGRTINTEYRHVQCRMIDLTPGRADTDAQSLLDEVDSTEAETEVAYRGSARHVNRLARTALGQHVRQSESASQKVGYRLEAPNTGVIDQLMFREVPRRKPGPGEVEVEICAAALNFRDVMKVLGIYPSENDLDLQVGDECAGRVVAIGKGVKCLKVGDEVVGSGVGCFASHLTVPALALVRKPARVSFPEAATIPVAFMTAWYALHHLGHIRRGEKILIQAATGGVGLAAIQIAQLAGAEVFATAGNPEKRDFLRALGVQHVMDSRSVAFADEVKEVTKGYGVDLVLNSLAGQAISKGLSCLAPHGRFLEIGKRDIYQNTAIGLRPFRNNVSMFVIDMGQVMQQRPEYVQTLLEPIFALFQQGKLRPLPHRTLPVSQAVGAFRLMAQARHIGKIVLSMQGDKVSPQRLPKVKSIRFRADASYLITGGLGGFGLAVARWMVESGARHVVLSSRNGAATRESQRAVKDLKHLGAKILVVKADMTRSRDVERLLKLIERRCPPLRGIMHAPMVLDDGMLAKLTHERFTQVMAPKVVGGWNLHAASAGLPLDFFVLFSSMSSLVGAAGQGNYAAANSFLDALANHRRALGLPALAVNWGALSEVGVVARNAKLSEHLAAHGVIGITPAQATWMLGRLLQGDATQIAFMRVDWQKFANASGGALSSLRYEGLVQTSTGDKPDADGGLRKAILSAPASERPAMVAARIREVVAKVLRTAAGKLETERPLKEMGLDSLMAFELLNHIEIQFGISLPPSKFSAGGSIASISAIVLEILAGNPAGPGEAGAATGELESQPAIQTARKDMIIECLADLRAEGSRLPLFCLHPAGGLVNIYHQLTQHLSADLPVIGVQSRAYSDDAGERSSVGEMAADYASLIEERQPAGPFRVAGFSVGGLFALATARELERRGREVAVVGLIDVPLSLLDPAYPKAQFLRKQIVEMYDYFAGEMGALKPLEPEDLSAAAGPLAEAILASPADAQPRLIMDWLIGRKLMLQDRQAAIFQRYIAVACAHWQMLGEMKTPVVQAPIRSWKAGQSGLRIDEPEPDWCRFAGGGWVEEIVDARHYEMMYPPQVALVAVRLEAALLETESATASRQVELVAK